MNHTHFHFAPLAARRPALGRWLHVAVSALLLAALPAHAEPQAADRPNILWITCEDTSPNLGCYGDAYASTPHLDRLAAEGVLYRNAYATASVCSPARSCIITGVHAGALGTQHLRKLVLKPERIRCFTEYLREAGYTTTNNVKQDYQFTTPAEAWDESSRKAHWRKRPAGTPFFSIFNLTMTHQSQTRYGGAKLQQVNDSLPPELRHDPVAAPLPPYYPDTPLVRENVAAYHTQITVMDRAVGKLLAELAKDGLTGDTIVFFFSDHGAGLPRGKRWLHRSGIHVPFIVRCPAKYRHLVPGAPGTATDRLVSFADLAPTVLSLVGLPVPAHMQGRAFLGQTAATPRRDVFASRDRVDEVILCSRTVVTERFQYIRNFHPHRPRMPLSDYSERTPIRQEVRRLAAAGTLPGTQGWLARRTTPAEELYDLYADPHEVANLASSAEHQGTLRRLRKTLTTRMREIRDTGVFTESEMHSRLSAPPYDGVRGLSDAQYEVILDTARRVGMGPAHRDELISRLAHSDSAVRYWAATGLLALGRDALPAEPALRQALQDASPSVRVAAAEALCGLGHEAEAIPVLANELGVADDVLATEITTALLAVGGKARPAAEALRAAQRRKLRYAGKNIQHILDALGLTATPAAEPVARPPGAIAGLSFSKAFGVRPGRCTEGGQCAAWIDNGDWSEYDIEVTAAGAHTVQLRVASQHRKGGTIRLLLGGKPLGSVDVPNTGGWQNWRTVECAVILPEAGRHTLRLEFAGGTGSLLNVSWFRVTPGR